MAKDYKHVNQRRRKKEVHPAVWGIGGFVLGALITTFLCPSSETPPQPEPVVEQAPPQSPAPSPAPAALAPAEPAKPEPAKIEFYDQLKQEDMAVMEPMPPQKTELAPPPKPAVKPIEPKPAAPKPTVKADQPKPKPAQSDGSYVVQVSSVRKFSDADKLRSQLALLGLRSRVKAARIENTTWYRIQLGPFNNKLEAQRAAQKLKQHGYNSFIKKVK